MTKSIEAAAAARASAFRRLEEQAAEHLRAGKIKDAVVLVDGQAA
ncbi:hypothetical protein [Paenibacillus nasutitermitis]|uniref:Uncharacterized protein n=1 Tax=Paenibacillus nasutitermitis TaxID=1652958 RepID=A0A916YV68_9BACL|nr:hypothetical protein [Paenibacillus nasutitermitis]GGD63249.1 hypothetical protein GCM10010911_21290 [Paenibacillus nasutitermitis]